MHVPNSFVCRALTYNKAMSVLFSKQLLDVYHKAFDAHLSSD